MQKLWEQKWPFPKCKDTERIKSVHLKIKSFMIFKTILNHDLFENLKMNSISDHALPALSYKITCNLSANPFMM